MSSQDRSEATALAIRVTLPVVDAVPSVPIGDDTAPLSNYPPKLRYVDTALPNSHRPTSS